MKIFYGDNDGRDFSNIERYAYLNWWFDNGYGGNGNPHQHIFDNYNMGKAFIGNALLSLNGIIESQNTMSVADKLIFPILFDCWHGLELWLKSSISALIWLTEKRIDRRKGHEIIQLTAELESLLKNNKCKEILQTTIIPLRNIVDEFKRVGAHFDFARYSFAGNGDYQFYNAPYNSDRQWQQLKANIIEETVPNTCIDIYFLFKLLTIVFEEFGSFVEYLTLCISEGESFSEDNYCNYLVTIKELDNILPEHELGNTPFSEIILREIMK